jgi:hypothetical protein
MNVVLYYREPTLKLWNRPYCSDHTHRAESRRGVHCDDPALCDSKHQNSTHHKDT